EGMSRAEVEAILGPPGDYRTGPVWYEDLGIVDGLTVPLENEFGARWYGDKAASYVFFTQSGCVEDWKRVDQNWLRGRRVDQSPLDNLLWRAKRQWRKWFPEKQ